MNIENHPCFNPGACKGFGRVHLPVAPRCNVQCNFCDRKFDCVNESRPGVTSSILKPFQAMAYLDEVFRKKQTISVVGIAGPGDPFANPEETLTTLEMVRRKYPDILLCVATNGLNLPAYLDEVAKLEVSHVSVTVNAVDPSIGAGIYSWIRYGRKTLSPDKGAPLLLERQRESIQGLKERGIIVKVNTIVLPGINDFHVPAIAEEMAALGVDILNVMPYYPNPGSNFGHLQEPSAELIADLRKKSKVHIPQMLHCKRCRADAVGLLDDADDISLMNTLRSCSSIKEPLTPIRKGYVAVASREGVLVNQHLGEARHLYIYNLEEGEPVLMERRAAPPSGGMDLRWNQMAMLLKDCGTLLVSGIGERPRQVLSQSGMEILEVGGLIDELVPAVLTGETINHMIKRERSACGTECSGTGMGCM